MVRALERAGLTMVRIRGSHHVMRHADGRATAVAVHADETIGPGLLAKMLRDVGMSREALSTLL